MTYRPADAEQIFLRLVVKNLVLFVERVLKIIQSTNSSAVHVIFCADITKRNRGTVAFPLTPHGVSMIFNG